MKKIADSDLTRIAVFVSGGGTNLQALIDAEKAGILRSGKICLVFSGNPDAYALKRAAANDISVKVLTGADAPADGEFDAKLLKTLEQYRIDMIVLAGYLQILSSEFIAAFPGKIINIHPSLIPAFCGKGMYGIRVHQAALQRGVKVTGATVHYVNEIPDGGEIILQKAVTVCKVDTPETLQQRVLKNAEWEILPKAAEHVAREILNAKKKKEQEQKKRRKTEAETSL